MYHYCITIIHTQQIVNYKAYLQQFFFYLSSTLTTTLDIMSLLIYFINTFVML
ncbi:hypothetical protein LEQ41_10645 [Streptococcus agalactiae]|nr:hypothetical protein [Streptococcus agalactiae]